MIKGVVLDISWHDEAGQLHRSMVLPVDVVTREGAEYLVFKGLDGAVQSIRLDLVTAASDGASGESLLHRQ